ncbi:Flp family type IVb pilin [Photobacterium sp. BZF1]|uniref:Flp family type IVb pilin n=1 Tax=Photobacterium sp. BZF1 TaxID=1904457 RepID=UPI0016537928|nr:Flp family type IVb pilin [Photobacterium sp. BZF1]MBC7002832.1 Flp family type IVb pilin [Photobacterium sp. BZF1]
MKSVKQFFIEFYKDEEGLTTVEYAIAGAVVAAGVATIFTNMGTQIKSKLNDLLEGLGGTKVA